MNWNVTSENYRELHHKINLLIKEVAKSKFFHFQTIAIQTEWSKSFWCYRLSFSTFEDINQEQCLLLQLTCAIAMPIPQMSWIPFRVQWNDSRTIQAIFKLRASIALKLCPFEVKVLVNISSYPLWTPLLFCNSCLFHEIKSSCKPLYNQFQSDHGQIYVV